VWTFTVGRPERATRAQWQSLVDGVPGSKLSIDHSGEEMLVHVDPTTNQTMLKFTAKTCLDGVRVEHTISLPHSAIAERLKEVLEECPYPFKGEVIAERDSDSGDES
jgi:hypothetical protein